MRYFRIFLFIIILLSLSSVFGQVNDNIELIGRWGYGHCKTIARWQNTFTFVGNGSILEVYGYGVGSSELKKFDQILLAGEINDIAIHDVTTTDDQINICVALGDTGFQMVFFYYQGINKGTFDTSTYIENTDGSALGVSWDQDDYIYIADGYNGLVVFDAQEVTNPGFMENIKTPSDARDVCVVNDSSVVVAVDTSGVLSISVKRNAQNEIITLESADTLEIPPHFPPEFYPEKSQPTACEVFTFEDYTYVAAGWGGLRMINAASPHNLESIGYWVNSGPVDVISASVCNDYVYILGVDAEDNPGLYTHIDISGGILSPDSSCVYRYNNLDQLENIIVANDTAFVANGYGGFKVLRLFNYSSVPMFPSQLYHFKTSDYTSDAVVSGNYCFTASGRTGVKIFDTNFTPPDQYMVPIDSLNTRGEALGICFNNNKLYVADGSEGLSIVDFTNFPYSPYIWSTPELVSVTDTCYDVDVSSSGFAFLACGNDGFRVIDTRYEPSELTAIGSPITTFSTTRAVKVLDDRVIVVDTAGVLVYDISALPNSISLTHILESPADELEPLGVDAAGDSVFIANGRHGLYYWDLSDDSFSKFASTTGKCTDILINKKTIYITDAKKGIRSFDLSLPDTLLKTGNFWTDATAHRIDNSGDKLCVADKEDGLYIVKSLVQPEISLSLTNIEFGMVPVGEKRTRILWIENNGSTLLKGSFSVSGNDSLFIFSPSEFKIPPGLRKKVSIEFIPSEQLPQGEQYNKIIHLLSNDPVNEDIEISFSYQRGYPIAKAAYLSDVFTAGLWHFNELSGGTAKDYSSNYLDGTWTNITSSGNGKFNNCYQFGGKNNPAHVEFPYHEDLNFTDNCFTVELWFNMVAIPQDYAMLALRGNHPNRQFELFLDPENGIVGRVYHASSDNEVATGSLDDLTVNQWYHVAFTWNRDSLKIYLNSIQKDSKLVQEDLINQDVAPLSVGAATTGAAPFEGLIDEVRVSTVDREPWEFNVSRSSIYIKEDTLFFGDILYKRKRSIPVYLNNQGGEELEITDVYSSSSQIDFSPQISESAPILLGAGEKGGFWATYTAKGYGDFNSTITIESNDPTFPEKSVRFQGKSVNSPQLGPYTSDPFTLGLWHFNYPSGPTGRMRIPDSSGNGMDGIWNGLQPGTAKARFDKAIYLDGNDDFCVMDTVGGHLLYSRWGGLTVEGWFYLDPITVGKQVLIKRGVDDNKQFGLFIDEDDRVVGNIYNKNKQKFEVLSNKPLESEKWYHLALVLYSDSLLCLYVDGSISSSTSVNGELISHTKSIDTLSVLVGGDWKGNNCFHGYIDEVRLSSVPRLPWEFSVRSASIVVSSDEIDFGKVLTGEQRSIQYQINNGSMEDTLRMWPVDIESLDYFSVPAGTLKVAPYGESSEMQSEVLTLTFTPSASGSFTEELSFVSNDPTYLNENFTISLTGEGFNTRFTDFYETDLFTAALYHFEEGSGAQATDSSGHGGSAALDNISWTESGRFGKAIQFTSLNSEVRITDVPYQTVENSTFTIEFWFNMDAIPDNIDILMNAGEGDNDNIKIFYHWDIGLVAELYDSNNELHQLKTDNLNFFITRQWYHCALSCDGDSLWLHLNNKCMDRKKLKNQIDFTDMGSIRFGSEPEGSTSYFSGIIDEIRFSNVNRHTWEYNLTPRELVVSPQQIQFPPIRSGASKSLDLWIANEGDEFLSTSIIIGTEEEFSLPDSVSHDDSFDTTLLGRSYMKIPVVYTPMTDEVSDTWLVTSNDPQNEQINLSIEGSSSTTLSVSPYVSDVHTVLLYPLNRVVQNNIIEDNSGNGNNGSLKNGSIGKAYFNNGVVFNGRSSRIEVPYDETLAFDFNKDNFTIECFFKTDTISQTLISRGVQTGNSDINYWIYLNSKGKIAIHGLGTFGQNVCDNAWHHVAVSYNRFTGEGSVFIDGELSGKVGWSEPPANLDTESLLIGAYQQAGGTYSGYFKGTIDEVRISSIFRTQLELSMGDFREEFDITVESTDPVQPEYNKPLDVDITVSSGLNVETVRFYYRAAGDTSYTSVTASFMSGVTYTCTVPAEDVKRTGLEYYISITTNQETLTSPRLDPEDNPEVLSVHHSGLKVPFIIPHREWKMFSIPFDLDNKGVDSILVDDLGAYSEYKWKVYAYREGRYRLCVPPDFYFYAGEAYWIQTNLEQTFDIGAGNSVTSSTNYEISLDSSSVDTTGFEYGWNMIGVPFNFPVDWKDCSISSSSIKGPYYWDGEQYIPPENITVLEPWKGYFFCNQSNSKQVLIIPPKKSSTKQAKKKLKKIHSTLDLTSEEWVFKIEARSDETKDIYNYAGVKVDADNAWDRYDQPEPPPISKNLALYFYHNDWDQYNGHYCSEYQKVGEEGYIWDFVVENCTDSKTYSLRFILNNTLPKDWEAYIFDLKRGVAKNILEDNSWEITDKAEDGELHNYKLVVGTEEFITNNNDDIPLVPVKFELYQNYPNPFNNNTVIKYGLPENSKVNIVIFNSLGQRIRELVNKHQKSGVHAVEWNGKDSAGLNVASGVYIYRLKTPKRLKVRKMVFIK
ncbi:MAG: LamG-like jellyroll fold domain-containing protein [bacterium]